MGLELAGLVGERMRAQAGPVGIILIGILLVACAGRGPSIALNLGKADEVLQGPPFMCRAEIPHSDVGSLRQERAQLDRANLLLQLCAAQWETAVALGRD